MSPTIRFNLLGTPLLPGGGTSAVPGVQQVLSTTSNYHYNGAQNGIAAAFPEFGNLFYEPTPSGSKTLQQYQRFATF
ncbi:MAG: hypothetical protein IPI66_12860 [Chitinophagaceae bacterium]|nr:hypothetical protein [Chitinophagaceae bacterium]